MKLNLKKCTFGMEEGIFLRYKVDAKGIKVCMDKMEAVLSLPSPKCLKDVQKLNGKLASLNRFMSKLAEKSLPLFKTLKKCTKKSDFQWTIKVESAFKQIKKLIAELPTLTAPMEHEELIVYLAVAEKAMSIVLMTEREAKKMSIYFVSRVLQDGSGAGLILTNPEGAEFTYALRFRFDATNNEAKYEDLIAGLRIAKQMGIKNLQENVDSRLVANQVNGSYIAKELGMIQYLEKVKTLARNFRKFSIKQRKREQAAIREAKSKAKMEKCYNSKARSTSFKPGDIVYRNNDANYAKYSGNLSPKWEGPYEVTEALGKGAYKLRDRNGKLLSRT
nr:reverse transcriptase domain-containing protein [Tanacetum cinerariifolium]